MKAKAPTVNMARLLLAHASLAESMTADDIPILTHALRSASLTNAAAIQDDCALTT